MISTQYMRLGSITPGPKNMIDSICVNCLSRAAYHLGIRSVFKIRSHTPLSAPSRTTILSVCQYCALVKEGSAGDILYEIAFTPELTND